MKKSKFIFKSILITSLIFFVTFFSCSPEDGLSEDIVFENGTDPDTDPDPDPDPDNAAIIDEDTGTD